MVDSSGSINENDGNNWQRVKTFMTDIVSSLSVDNGNVQIGTVMFSDTATTEFNLRTYTNTFQINNHILGLRYLDGGTNTAAALREMNEQFRGDRGDRTDAPNVAIVITDGRSQNRQDTIAQAVAARNRGVQIISVGVTDNVDVNEIQQISSSPQEEDRDWFLIADFTRLASLVEAVTSSACGTPVPPTPGPGESTRNPAKHELSH